MDISVELFNLTVSLKFTKDRPQLSYKSPGFFSLDKPLTAQRGCVSEDSVDSVGGPGSSFSLLFTTTNEKVRQLVKDVYALITYRTLALVADDAFAVRSRPTPIWFVARTDRRISLNNQRYQ